MRIVVAIAALLSAASADVVWEQDFEKAKLRSIKEDKLIFLDFYADW